MSGWLILAFGAAIAVTDFVTGLRFSRMTPDQLQPNADGTRRSAEPANRMGRMLMLVAPLILILFAAMAFGIFPVGGIEPIVFN
jgi:hypothetical protein